MPVTLQHGKRGAIITTTSTQVAHGPGSLPGQRAVRHIDRGPNYPGRSELNVLSAEADSIRVYDEMNIRRCITELLQSDPNDGGQDQLDQHVPPGVTFTAVSVEETGFPSWVGGEVDGWDGRVGEQRGTADWIVPDDCSDMSCRIVFIHGGLNMWYGGQDPAYRPATARMAKAARMPVLSIDFRLAPEHPFPASTDDAVQAISWLRGTYPGAGGPSPAAKVFLLGDSSGGGVALSAAIVAKRAGILVDGCCAICPTTDYTFSSGSYRTRMWDAGTMTGDPVFTESQAFDTLGLQPGEAQARIDREERQAYAAANYLGDIANDDPTFSPVRSNTCRYVTQRESQSGTERDREATQRHRASGRVPVSRS